MQSMTQPPHRYQHRSVRRFKEDDELKTQHQEMFAAAVHDTRVICVENPDGVWNVNIDVAREAFVLRESTGKTQP